MSPGVHGVDQPMVGLVQPPGGFVKSWLWQRTPRQWDLCLPRAVVHCLCMFGVVHEDAVYVSVRPHLCLSERV